MKFIKKGGAPHAYVGWCRTVEDTDKESYLEMPRAIKNILLASLSKQQGEICAYTMRRIDMRTSHVEHVKPESLCRLDKKGSDLEFGNMVACFPRDGMRRQYRYGAQKKDDWWNPTLFVSPLNAVCELRFRFNERGEISPVRNNGAAVNTIKVLGLDNEGLQEDRSRAIQEILYGDTGTEPLSKAKASRLRAVVCSLSGGKYIEFCVAIRDALEDYIRYVEKLQRKKKFGKSRKR